METYKNSVIVQILGDTNYGAYSVQWETSTETGETVQGSYQFSITE